jgi:RNA recognition motif-containing protein
VGNLNFETTQGELENLFSEVGQVDEVFMPADRATGRPRGFAFITFADEEAMKAAIEKFDGFDLGGRNLKVNEAQERPQRSPRPFGGGGGGGYNRFKPKPKGSRKGLRNKKRGY